MLSLLRGTTSFTPSTTPSALVCQIRHATKRAGGSSRNNRDSPGQRLGVKLSGGSACKTGQIIIRQRGTVWHAGTNVGLGRDHTLFALQPGFVKFYTDPTQPRRQFVGVVFDRHLTLPERDDRPRLRRLGLYDAIAWGDGVPKPREWQR